MRSRWPFLAILILSSCWSSSSEEYDASPYEAGSSDGPADAGVGDASTDSGDAEPL
jgi:hypothetical protein